MERYRDEDWEYRGFGRKPVRGRYSPDEPERYYSEPGRYPYSRESYRPSEYNPRDRTGHDFDDDFRGPDQADSHDRGLGMGGFQDLRGIDADPWHVPGPHTGRGPRGYESGSNERIRIEVCERLARNGRVDASDIEVKVEDGEVTLEGTVDSRHIKRIAEDVAESVQSVRDVHNRLRINRKLESQAPPLPL